MDTQTTYHAGIREARATRGTVPPTADRERGRATTADPEGERATTADPERER